MENVDFLINDYETYKYTIPAKQLRPTVYVRCQASDKLNEIIHFDDAVVENLCVENWDTNGDGHLSKIEAANVTSLGKVFRENDEIISFNELQYFTGLTALNDSAFKGCTELKYVILPKDMTTIGKNAFQNSGLLEIALPSKLTTLFSYAFAGCKNIEHIEIPSGVMSLPSYCFLECTGLKRLYIPKECYRFNQYPIGGCTGLISIVVEEGNRLLSSPKSCNAIIYGDTLLLAGCRNTYIPDSVKIIYNYAFYDMKDLTSI
ncbi:MAG: leucine-rich repeat domain-containing protein, partial [Prevotella sp.]|nr:leucine-rich repeat domain-containing protein [Prevotella sp.]